MPRRMELRRIATLWDCTADFEVTGPNTAVMWEPLDVCVPLTASPFCCYVNTVIFYRDASHREEVARCVSHDLNTPSPSLVFLGGAWWECGGASVVQRDGRWSLARRLARNTRMALEANLGRAAVHHQLAAVHS